MDSSTEQSDSFSTKGDRVMKEKCWVVYRDTDVFGREYLMELNGKLRWSMLLISAYLWTYRDCAEKTATNFGGHIANAMLSLGKPVD